MKQSINRSQFHDAFHNMNRKDNFSYEGLNALFDYLEMYESDIGEELELDVVALCCEFSEYIDLEEFQGTYNAEDYESIEDIENATTVIRLDNGEGFIIQDF